MTREDLLYHRLMLGVGETEAFDAALLEQLAGSAPYDELTLALTDCGKDHAAMVSVLHRYLQGGAGIDLAKVPARIRETLYARYHAGLSVGEIVAMGISIEDTPNAEYGANWYGFREQESLLDLIADGIVAETPEGCCEVYLLTGRSIDPFRRSSPQKL